MNILVLVSVIVLILIILLEIYFSYCDFKAGWYCKGDVMPEIFRFFGIKNNYKD